MKVNIYHYPKMYEVYDAETGEFYIARTAPDNVFFWLSQQGACEINFIDKTIEIEEEEEEEDYEDYDLESGFDPYVGCYTWDC